MYLIPLNYNSKYLNKAAFNPSPYILVHVHVNKMIPMIEYIGTFQCILIGTVAIIFNISYERFQDNDSYLPCSKSKCFDTQFGLHTVFSRHLISVFFSIQRI